MVRPAGHQHLSQPSLIGEPKGFVDVPKCDESKRTLHWRSATKGHRPLQPCKTPFAAPVTSTEAAKLSPPARVGRPDLMRVQSGSLTALVCAAEAGRGTIQTSSLRGTNACCLPVVVRPVNILQRLQILNEVLALFLRQSQLEVDVLVVDHIASCNDAKRPLW